MLLRFLFYILLSTTPICYGQASPNVYVLGIAQDGGYPHMGCLKLCCNKAWQNDSLKKFVTSLAIADPSTNKWWLIEATPDINAQLHFFQKITNGKYNYLPDGILLTHAHIGHYAGLIQLGREVLNTNKIPVYAMPRMIHYLTNNGPWSQLVALQNIVLMPIVADSLMELTNNVSIAPFLVPHRDEFSETVGFKIITTNKKYLFLPDINKWNIWNRSIVSMVKEVDIALLDGTFGAADELPGRNMSEVPHPFITETMQLFNNENEEVRKKVHFIHFNHTNPAMWDKQIQREIKSKGYQLATQGGRL